MKTRLFVLAACLLVSLPTVAEDVLQKYKCTVCHDATAKKMGPTWKTIAARATEADIRSAIQKGSKGKYGKAAMPPQPKAVADAGAIAKAILAMK